MSEAEKESAVTVPNETPAPADDEPSVASLLSLARRQRAVSTTSAAADSKIPLIYIEMLESGDRDRIADQIYLVPFVRRYAAFLRLDPEEMVTRFVQEVQHADLSASRIEVPINLGGPGGRRLPLWVWIGGLVLAVAIGYGVASKVHSWRIRGAASSHFGESAAPNSKARTGSAVPASKIPPTQISHPPSVRPARSAETRAPARSGLSAAPGEASGNRKGNTPVPKR